MHPTRPTRHRPLTTTLLVLLLAAVSLPAAAAPMATLDEAKVQAKRQLNRMLFGIKMFHHEARGSIANSMSMPQFEEYFELPESLQNRYDELGRLILSDEQKRIRDELEGWIGTLHDRFPIAESCLIDKYGQEHMRVSGNVIEHSDHFSSTEQGSPFFKGGFELAAGQTYLSAPYMSMDALEWVVAFATPVVLDDGSIPAIFHFEVPLSNYRELVSSETFHFDTTEQPVVDTDEEGRSLIVDPNGLLIADSRQSIRYRLHDERNPDLNHDLPDYMPAERIEEYLPHISTVSEHPAFLGAVARMRHMTSGILDLEIDGRTYVFAFDELAEQPWYVIHLDPVDGPGFWYQD